MDNSGSSSIDSADDAGVAGVITPVEDIVVPWPRDELAQSLLEQTSWTHEW